MSRCSQPSTKRRRPMLSLELRRTAAQQKLKSLKRQRARAVLDDNGESFALLSREISAVEADIAATDRAVVEADDEMARQRAADRPRLERERHARRVAQIRAVEEARLAAIMKADQAAVSLVDALAEAIKIGRQHGAALADPTQATVDPAPSAEVYLVRLSQYVAVALTSLSSPQWFGQLNLACAAQAQAGVGGWAANERKQLENLIRGFENRAEAA